MTKYGGQSTNENEAIKKKYYIFQINIRNGNVGDLFAYYKHFVDCL